MQKAEILSLHNETADDVGGVGDVGGHLGCVLLQVCYLAEALTHPGEHGGELCNRLQIGKSYFSLVRRTFGFSGTLLTHYFGPDLQFK